MNESVERLPVVLVHGGLYDDPPMTGEVFWGDSGVVDALRDRGVEVVVHQRPATPRSWADERAALATTIRASGHDRIAVVAGSNGCSVALRLLLDTPALVVRTMLCWPATPGDTVIDDLARVIIVETHDDEVATGLLEGRPVRGVVPADLGTITSDVVIHPSMPENKVHKRTTVTELMQALGSALLVGGSPEPPDPGFAAHRDGFADLVAAFAEVHPDD